MLLPSPPWSFFPPAGLAQGHSRTLLALLPARLLTSDVVGRKVALFARLCALIRGGDVGASTDALLQGCLATLEVFPPYDPLL